MSESVMTQVPSSAKVSPRRWRFPRFWSGWHFGWLEASFLGLVLVALGLRLWELDGRTMHYDEGIHVHYAWRLAIWEGAGYIHSPWMHGPFQIEFTALIFRLFGDSDFTARLGYTLFGTALVGLPYILRGYLGRAGAIMLAVMLMLSPALLYFSRFGRNDIIMAFWATALLVLMWRYIHEGKHRYLYLASAVLAFMFATKETAYIVVLIYGLMMFFLAVPDLIPWVLRRSRLSDLVGPAGFFLLLVTLTLPQWSAAIGVAQGALGLTLVNPEGVADGIVGAPHWVEPFLFLPVYDALWFLHVLPVVLLMGGLFWISGGRRATLRSLLRWVGVPLLAVAAVCLLVFRPIDGTLPSGSVPLVVDLPIAGVMALVAIGILVYLRYSWRRGTWLVIIPALLTVLYTALFTSVVNVDGLVNGVLPGGLRVDASTNGIPVNFLVAGGVLLATFLLSIYLGVRWLGGVWLICAAIFYLIWLTLYTTFFTNGAGFFSGIWQGMGYWIAQQEVARGNQPWYYYFLGMSVYELLPVVFGLLGAIYFVKKGDIFGLALAFWAGLTFLVHTLASEKMPWLLVNITLPFILLAGKYLGGLWEQVPWRRVLRHGYLLLLLLPPLGVAAGVYLLYGYVDTENAFSDERWVVLAGVVFLAIASAYLVRIGPQAGSALVGLGMAALLLGFGTVGAFRAAYTYDDSNEEILVYAQGSADLQETFRGLDRQVFSNNAEGLAVQVDRDLWYPFNWYVRHEQKAGTLRFSCIKEEDEPGWHAGCAPPSEGLDTPVLLLTREHGGRHTRVLSEYEREGPQRNLLWFPESYRRPFENREAEGSLWGNRGIPGKEQLTKDWEFFKEVATSRDSWRDALDYLIFRDLDQGWLNSEYYSYTAK